MSGIAPLPEINGYYTSGPNGMCLPFDDAKAEKEDAKPALSLTDTRNYGPLASDDSDFGLFGSSIVGGCGVEPDACESNSTPTIYSLKLLDLDGEPFSALYKPKAGDQVSLLIKAETCAGGTSNLDIEVRFNEEAFVALSKNGDGYYVYDFTAPAAKPGLPHLITIKATDTNRKTKVEQNYEFWVESETTQPSQYIVYADYHDDGAIPGREIDLSIHPVNEDYTYTWTVTGPGFNSALSDGEIKGTTTFTPPQSGVYNVLCSIQRPGEDTPLTKSTLLQIYDFPKPEVKVAGDQSPKAGDTAYYTPLILGGLDEYKLEKNTCEWTVHYLNEMGKPVEVNFEIVDPDSGELITDSPPSCDKVLKITYPQDLLKQRSYVIGMKVSSNDDYYELAEVSLPVIAYPTGTAGPLQADILVSYDNDGAIPFRPVFFDAILSNLDPEASYDYIWDIYERDGNGDWKSLAVLDGPAIQYPFLKNDKYKVKLSAYEGENLVDTKEELITIYPFPKPSVGLDINHNEAIHTGETASITLEIGRDWAEDQAAITTFDITKVGSEILPMCLPTEDPQAINCVFPVSGKYLITSTTVGLYNGDTTAYTVPQAAFADVYLAEESVIAANYSVVYPQDGAITHREFTFNASLTGAPQGNYDYIWTIKQKDGEDYIGPQPPAGANTDHTFPESGFYVLTLEIFPQGGAEAIAKKTNSFQVHPFPKPDLALDINGNQPAFIGLPVTVTGIILRDWPEDQNADYSFLVENSILGETLLCTTINSNSCQFTPNLSGTYSVGLTVTGENGIYVTPPETESVKVYQIAEDVISADFSIVYPEDGAIAHREFNFDACLIGVPAGNHDYVWTIEEKDGQPYEGPHPENWINTDFTFSEPGIYKLTLEVFLEGTAQSITKTKNFQVHPFPKPQVAIDINSNEPIFANVGEASFLAHILRDWPEDNPPYISYDWTITTYTVVGDEITSETEKTSTNQAFSCSLDFAGERVIHLTITSQDPNGVTIYYNEEKIESFEVYPQ